MTLYEIDGRISDLIENGTDPETGELTVDIEALNALQMEREQKLENIALYLKNITAEAAAIKAESDALTERRRVLERKADKMRELLTTGLAGEKFTTPRVSVTFRKSKALELDEEKFLSWAAEYPQFTRRKDPEPDKVTIKEGLKQGMTIPGAEIVEKMNIIVK